MFVEMNDIETGRPFAAIIRGGPASFLFALSFALGSDIEVAFGLDDCKQITAMLEQAAGTAQSAGPQGSLKHGFRNLDGDVNGAVVITPQEGALELNVRDSVPDFAESGLTVRISLEDTKRLVQVLRTACPSST